MHLCSEQEIYLFFVLVSSEDMFHSVWKMCSILQNTSMCNMYYKTHQCVLSITKLIDVYYVLQNTSMCSILQNTSMCSMYYKTHQCVICITKHINV
jgi:hypothetical protein